MEVSKLTGLEINLQLSNTCATGIRLFIPIYNMQELVQTAEIEYDLLYFIIGLYQIRSRCILLT